MVKVLSSMNHVDSLYSYFQNYFGAEATATMHFRVNFEVENMYLTSPTMGICRF